MFGIESHSYQDQKHFPIVDQASHQKSFDHLSTSSLISIVMRPDLATSGNLKVKCVVTLLTLYHRSNEISVETVGLVKPKLKSSRHLSPLSIDGHSGNGDYLLHYNSASAGYFADSRINSSISRYKLTNHNKIMLLLMVAFVKFELQ